jgi:two-component system nitrogen regulation sensor histidine kinase NtrY
VADNGSGLPKDIDIQSLCEPYVTNKNKGTGIGLAIVKKIIEDHDGELLFNPDLNIMDLMDKPYKTLIAFTLPLREA